MQAPAPTREPSQNTVFVVGTPLGAIGATVLLISGLSFFGEWWWILDIAANFRPQLAVMGLGVALGASALKLRAIVFIGLVTIALNAVPILALYNGSPSTGTAPDVRVASYNLLQSAGEGRTEVVDWLETLEADVVFLHEVSARWARFIGESGLPYEVVAPQIRRGQFFGTMALIRPGATVEILDFLYRPTPAVTIDVDGEDVTVLGIHALSPYSSERSSIRDSDFLALGEWVNDQTTDVIVAGDFNATPFSWSFRRLLEISELENSQRGFGLQPTWPTTNIFLRIPIDHLLHTPGLAVVDRRVDESFGSDHYPIVVDLARAG